jgi:ribosomal-protein-alanine N-acetyltransferase
MQFDVLPLSDHPEVELRPIQADDLPVWLAYVTLPDVYQHTSWNDPTLEDLSPYIWSEAMREPAKLLRLAIASRSSGELVGTVGFHTVTPRHRSAEMAYDLSPTHRGRGIAQHVVKLVTRWAHESAQLLRVQATVLDSNLRSVRVLERAGFTREGLLRSYRLVGGVPGNFYMYSHVASPQDVI